MEEAALDETFVETFHAIQSFIRPQFFEGVFIMLVAKPKGHHMLVNLGVNLLV